MSPQDSASGLSARKELAAQPDLHEERKQEQSPIPKPSPELFVIKSDPVTSSEKHTDSPTLGEPEETYPEGGLRAWLVVLGCWLALFSCLSLMNTLATFQTYVSTHQLAEYDEGTIGWIFSLYTFLAFFLGVYIGPVFDKYGPRWLVLSGTVCLVTSLMLLSICTGNHIRSLFLVAALN